jgi:hypothetical protein
MKSFIIPIIVEQHAGEAAFLWLLRDAAVRAPHYSLKDLARLDDRVEAHMTASVSLVSLGGRSAEKLFAWKSPVRSLLQPCWP